VQCPLKNSQAVNKVVILSVDKGLEQSYCEGSWVTVVVSSSKYLRWFSGQEKRSHGALALVPSKLKNLNSLLLAQRGLLEFPCLKGIAEDQYQYINGRHRAYWLASVGGCDEIPLRISAKFGEALFAEISSY
jgi:hypothetical protein